MGRVVRVRAALRGGVFMAIALLALAQAPARAALWAEPGDARLRADLEVLAAHGVIDRTLTTWPLPLASLAGALDAADSGRLPPHAAQSLFRVRSFIAGESRPGPGGGADLRVAAGRAAVIRTFDATARGTADVHALASYRLPRTALTLRAGVIADEGGSGETLLSFDGSHIVQGAGNMLFYAGTVDQWWGPGEAGSLILSTNARPFPRIGFMRADPRPFAWRGLNWLGPWQFNMFLGRMEEERVVANPLLWGMRLSVAPAKGLELGFSRVIQLCGEGRPCGGGTWWRAFIGRDNEVATPEDIARQPGNQLAGLDAAYIRPVGDMVAKLHVQMIAEDSDDTDVFPFQFGVQAGAALTGGLGGGRWRVALEYADTAVRDAPFFGENRYNVFYEHFIYRTGYRYEGEAVGHTLDNDGRMVSLLAGYQGADGIGYRLEYHHVEANRDGTVRGPHSLSARAGDLNLFLAGASLPLPRGELALTLRLDDVALTAPDTHDLHVAGELGLKVRF